MCRLISAATTDSAKLGGWRRESRHPPFASSGGQPDLAKEFAGHGERAVDHRQRQARKRPRRRPEHNFGSATRVVLRAVARAAEHVLLRGPHGHWTKGV